jgi:hypothetical protein
VNLRQLLREQASGIVEDWFQAIVATYPPETARFLKQRKDRFANPVGATLSKEITNIYRGLLEEGVDAADLDRFLDRIVRIRAVQDYSADAAVGFIFDLKKVVRRRLGDKLADGALAAELREFEDLVDRLALKAFAIYASCREQLHMLKVNEMRNLYARVLERSGVFVPVPEQAEPDGA